MIVPEFWAEARIQKRFPDRQITVRRFGWSDKSEADAQQHADERVKDAFERIVRGEALPRRERKVRYNGDDGLPIREEVVDRTGDSIVTRNSYGARCLNTPDVFFADVDFPETFNDSCAVWVVSFFIACAVAGYTDSTLFGVLAFPVPILLHYGFLWIRHQWRTVFHGGIEAIALDRIQSFSDAHPEWHLRIYRSPNGFRILAMHNVFDPRSAEVENAFRMLEVDPTYMVMCQKQNCFRARLTAKPWRIGIESRLKPRPGVWPIAKERLPARRVWVKEYESTASNYAACRFVKAVGAVHKVNAKAKSICDYHDRICQVQANIELA